MSISAWILDLFYPPRCVLCGKLLGGGMRDFCAPCRMALPIFTGTASLNPEFAGAAVALKYEGQVRSAFLRYKFNGRAHYAGSFAPLLAAAASTLPLGEIDAVTWSPVSRQRKRQRGYDQSLLLAKRAAAILDKPLERCLEKWRDTPPQSGLDDPEARRVNVLGAYRPHRDARCAGKRYLLIDDILTTGSTAREAGRILLSAGATAVYFAALATGRDP